jgi:osmoprotectant transport system permease protein
MTRTAAATLVAVIAALTWPAEVRAEHVVVGSKAFPESWILAEALTGLARRAGASAEHMQNLGATEITYGALTTGSIDIYPEYTGTIREVLLRGSGAGDLDTMRGALGARGIGMSEPLGFDDSYALATSSRPQNARVRTISDLALAPDLRVGLTHEFLGRADGYPGLASRYGLALRDVRGIQHELALEALGRGELDVVDVYTTDAQIDRLALRVLDDDRHFFPRYDAVLLYRADLPARAAVAFEAMMRLVGRVDATAVRKANARVVLDGMSVRDAALALRHDVLGEKVDSAEPASSLAGDIAHNTLRHVELVVAALLAAIVLGVPLGVLAARSRVLALVTTSVTGLVQTVPSLALLALLVPLLGIGAKPALTALLLYGLLPIVRGTHVGLTTIPLSITESAEALGLAPGARLTRVFLPLASPHILAGIRTSAVIAVGTATLAALIGAEGLGGPILQGIALRNAGLVLQGAVPAALLALGVDGGFALASRFIVPTGLRRHASRAP